jgi:arginase
MNVEAAARTARSVADLVEKALPEADLILLLGGDCTVELGMVAGVRRAGTSVGLVYVDLDVDLNIPETSDGALDWTGVAHLLDLPGCAAALSHFEGASPLLAPESILFYGAANITQPEAETIAQLGLPVVSLDDVRGDPAGSARRAVDWARSFDHLLVHVDVDVLEYVHFPIAENVRREPGLDIEALASSLHSFAQAPNFRALTLAEVNPDHAPDEAATFAALVRLVCSTMNAASRARREAQPPAL